jgi:peptide/nickel transport system substrate-binding protein
MQMKHNYSGNKFNRRTFLKVAGVAGAGLAVQTTFDAPAVLGKAPRNELVVGLFSEPKGITPMLRKTVTGNQVGNQLYDTLMRMEDPARMEIIPWLVENWQQEDASTYVFKLREGVKWHKGYGEVTAEDAAWSYNTRMKLAGRGGALSYVDYAEERGKYTFAVKLRAGFGSFINVWSHTHFSIIHCKKAFEDMGQDGFNRNPIGNGPFELEEWKPGVHIKLKKFEGYWNPLLPKLERIKFLFIPDNFVKVEKLRKGELDFIDSPGYSELPALLDEPTINVVNPVGDEWDYIACNLTLPKEHPLQHPEVREAIAYGINRDSIVQDVYYGNARATDLPFVPPFPGSEHPAKYPMSGDPERARQLLKKAGFPNGFEVSCITSSKQELRDELVVIAAQLEEIGIRLKIQNLNMASYRAATTKQGQLAGGALKYELALEDISLSGPDSDPCAYWFLHSQAKTYSRYSNVEMDKALDAGRSSTDMEKRKDYYNKVGDLIHRDNPMIYTVFPRLAFCQNSQLAGFRPTRTEFNISFDSIHWTT